jgi:hypothetical protein
VCVCVRVRVCVCVCVCVYTDHGAICLDGKGCQLFTNSALRVFVPPLSCLLPSRYTFVRISQYCGSVFILVLV